MLPTVHGRQAAGSGPVTITTTPWCINVGDGWPATSAATGTLLTAQEGEAAAAVPAARGGERRGLLATVRPSSSLALGTNARGWWPTGGAVKMGKALVAVGIRRRRGGDDRSGRESR